jgi:predicted kinase
MHPNIALYGTIASGKTTVADILVSDHGYTRVSLAAPLKRLAELSREVLAAREAGSLQTDTGAWLARKVLVENLTDKVTHSQFVLASAELVDDLRAEGKPRRWLQQIGTELFRAADPDVWVCAFANSLQFQPAPWVCDDCRFLNELSALRAAGFKLVKCCIPEEQRLQRMERIYGSSEGDAHASENELRSYAQWDGVVDTACAMDEQAGQVDVMLGMLAAQEAPNV